MSTIAGEMLEKTATELVAEMRDGTLKPSDLMAETLSCIDRVNPKIHAIVAQRDQNALMAEARLLVRRARETEPA